MRTPYILIRKPESCSVIFRLSHLSHIRKFVGSNKTLPSGSRSSTHIHTSNNNGNKSHLSPHNNIPGLSGRETSLTESPFKGRTESNTFTHCDTSKTVRRVQKGQQSESDSKNSLRGVSGRHRGVSSDSFPPSGLKSKHFTSAPSHRRVLVFYRAVTQTF